ncbi:arginase family protein [Kitasatospora sp. NPDC088346]|uniref:arginase family protein n=1 Tax=Kitasatospora sp. NPDC088346 TaxID=3364073 RepID=UPI0037FBC11F
MVRELALLGVPSCAGTHGPGQEKAPDAVRAAGLLESLAAAGITVRDHGNLPVVPFRTDPDHRDRQNLDRVVEVVRSVADRVGTLLDGGALPLVIGGDCTITLGVVSAFVARWPDTGLLYFDGDLDLSVPETTRSGILDTMVLSHLFGDGAPELAGAGPRVPLLPAEGVVAFGHDPVELDDAGRARFARHRLRAHPCTTVTAPGADPVGTARAAWHSLVADRSRFVLHFDVDVIDSVDLPLGDFPHFNEGLPLSVALDCLTEFASAPQLAGVVVTEINPNRDPDGSLVRTLVGGLVRALTGAPPA